MNNRPVARLLTAFAISFAIASHALAYVDWIPRNPFPQGNTLNGIAKSTNLFVEVGDGGVILASTNGTQWGARESGTIFDLHDIAYGNGTFVAVGAANGYSGVSTIITSSNGFYWSSTGSPGLVDLYCVAFYGGVFVAAGDLQGGFPLVMFSANGRDWTRENTTGFTAGPITDVAFGQTNLLVIDDNGDVEFTPFAPGQLSGTWTFQNNPNNPGGYGLAAGAGIFVAVGDGGDIRTQFETNLASAWDATPAVGGNEALVDVCFNGSRFLLAGTDNDSGQGVVRISSDATAVDFSTRISTAEGLTGSDLQAIFCPDATMAYTSGTGGSSFYSTNGGNTFIRSGYGGVDDINDIVYGEGFWVAVSDNGQVLRSSDRTNWLSVDLGFWQDIYGVTYANGQFVAVGQRDGSDNRAVALTSPEGTNWTSHDLFADASLNAVCYGFGLYVAVGNGGLCFTSPDGVAWTPRNSLTGQDLNDVSFIDDWGLFLAVGDNGVISTSLDGVNWTIRDAADAHDYYTVAYGIAPWWADVPGTNIAVIAGENGNFDYSYDGISWSSDATGQNTTILDMLYAANVWVVTCINGFIFTSEDLDIWIYRDSNTANDLNRVAFEGYFIGVGDGGSIVTSILNPEIPGDYNGDGTSDLVVQTGTIPGVLFMNGTVPSATPIFALPELPVNATVAATVQYDRGRTDLIVQQGKKISIIANDGLTNFAAIEEVGALGPKGKVVGSGNFNTLLPDSLIVQSGRNIAVVKAADPDGTPLAQFVAPARAKVIGTMDFDGDGRVDFVVQAGTQVQVLYGDGAGNLAVGRTAAALTPSLLKGEKLVSILSLISTNNLPELVIQKRTALKVKTIRGSALSDVGSGTLIKRVRIAGPR